MWLRNLNIGKASKATGRSNKHLMRKLGIQLKATVLIAIILNMRHDKRIPAHEVTCLFMSISILPSVSTDKRVYQKIHSRRTQIEGRCLVNRFS